MGFPNHSANESFEEKAEAAKQEVIVETNDAEVKSTEVSNETTENE